MVRGYRTLMFKPDRSPCKTKGLSFTLLWQNVSKSRRTYKHLPKYSKPRRHTHMHTQAHRTAKLSFIPVILLLPKGSHTFQVQLQVFTSHLHSHWVWCLWYGCVMGFDYHNTTSTPKRQTNFFPFYLV